MITSTETPISVEMDGKPSPLTFCTCSHCKSHWYRPKREAIGPQWCPGCGMAGMAGGSGSVWDGAARLTTPPTVNSGSVWDQQDKA